MSYCSSYTEEKNGCKSGKSSNRLGITNRNTINHHWLAIVSGSLQRVHLGQTNRMSSMLFHQLNPTHSPRASFMLNNRHQFRKLSPQFVSNVLREELMSQSQSINFPDNQSVNWTIRTVEEEPLTPGSRWHNPSPTSRNFLVR